MIGDSPDNAKPVHHKLPDIHVLDSLFGEDGKPVDIDTTIDALSHLSDGMDKGSIPPYAKFLQLMRFPKVSRLELDISAGKILHKGYLSKKDYARTITSEFPYLINILPEEITDSVVHGGEGFSLRAEYYKDEEDPQYDSLSITVAWDVQAFKAGFPELLFQPPITKESVINKISSEVYTLALEHFKYIRRVKIAELLAVTESDIEETDISDIEIDLERYREIGISWDEEVINRSRENMNRMVKPMIVSIVNIITKLQSLGIGEESVNLPGFNVPVQFKQFLDLEFWNSILEEGVGNALRQGTLYLVHNFSSLEHNQESGFGVQKTIPDDDIVHKIFNKKELSKLSTVLAFDHRYYSLGSMQGDEFQMAVPAVRFANECIVWPNDLGHPDAGMEIGEDPARREGAYMTLLDGAIFFVIKHIYAVLSDVVSLGTADSRYLQATSDHFFLNEATLFSDTPIPLGELKKMGATFRNRRGERLDL